MKIQQKRYNHLWIFFCLTAAVSLFGQVADAQVKILSNSRHAFGSITDTIDQLLGSGHVGIDIIVDSTSMSGDTFSGGPSAAIDTNATYYDYTGATVSSSAPYGINTTSYTGYAGDTVTLYNTYVNYDLTYNYAFTVSTNSPPPSFHTAPGGPSHGSNSGVEWTIPDGPEITFSGSTLSELTARNAGLMAVVRYDHPDWNWYDVKAALRQTADNWDTGYDYGDYGFGNVSYASSTALADNEILLQAPAAETATTSFDQITFTLYPFKQSKRVKEVLFQFDSDPGFQGDELSLNDITVTLGGTKVTEYTDTTATSTIAPIFTAFSDKYFVWFTADDASDNSASFSRIDTYSVLGPIDQNDIQFHSNFNIVSPANNDATDELPTFSWTEPDSYFGIAKYQLYIDGSLDTDNITSTSSTPSTPLSEGSHTWYVQAINNNGATSTSQSAPTIQTTPGYNASQTWYVDNLLGDDSNTGSQASPWATIAKATSIAEPGNTVVIINNDDLPYRETIQPAGGDSQDGNIVIRGVDSDNKPEVWGSSNFSQDVVGDWSVYGAGNPNTYQRGTFSIWGVTAFLAGSATSTIEKRTLGLDINNLAEGEWINFVGSLYYRLRPGEDINTLHIEASLRNYGIYCNYKNTFRDIIVRHTISIGVLLGEGCVGERLESYDNGADGVFIYDLTNTSEPSATLSYAVVAGNNDEGIEVHSTDGAKLYNNTVTNNDTGLLLNTSADNSIMQNNIFASNTKNIEFQSIGSLNNFSASNNNWYSGTIESAWANTYQGEDNQSSTSPLLRDVSSRDFTLQYTSPNVDSGIDVSLTVDSAGDPIYGNPDIGAYEYQPPYTLGNDTLNQTGAVKIYADGKYRYTTATTSTSTADLLVAPADGFGANNYAEYMELTIDTWEPVSDTTVRSWTASSSYATSTTFTVSGLTASDNYEVTVDNATSPDITGTDCSDSICTATTEGEVTFTYSGGWSSHIFTVTRTEESPGGGGSSSSGGGSRSKKTEDTAEDNTASSSEEMIDTDDPSHRQSLIERISELKRLIGVLTAQLHASQSNNNSLHTQFTHRLTVGDESQDVLALQLKLNRLGFIIAETGAGSPGNETSYYGPLTTAAIKKFQCYYHIVCEGAPGTTGFGNFGPQTRARLNDL